MPLQDSELTIGVKVNRQRLRVHLPVTLTLRKQEKTGQAGSEGTVCVHERESAKKHLDKSKEGCFILNKCGTGKKCGAYLDGKAKRVFFFKLSQGWSDNRVTLLLLSPLSRGMMTLLQLIF